MAIGVGSAQQQPASQSLQPSGLERVWKDKNIQLPDFLPHAFLFIGSDLLPLHRTQPVVLS
jgi:hypothetical protein